MAHALRHPRETVTETVATGESIARVLRPVSDTLSPVMTERHLAWRYDVLRFPLTDMLAAAHAAGVTHNDAFLVRRHGRTAAATTSSTGSRWTSCA